MLAAAVDILLAAGDLESARAAGTELAEIAGTIGAPLLHARRRTRSAQSALPKVKLLMRRRRCARRGKSGGISETPYEEARTCVLMAAVCERPR